MRREEEVRGSGSGVKEVLIFLFQQQRRTVVMLTVAQNGLQRRAKTLRILR